MPVGSINVGALGRSGEEPRCRLKGSPTSFGQAGRTKDKPRQGLEDALPQGCSLFLDPRWCDKTRRREGEM